MMEVIQEELPEKKVVLTPSLRRKIRRRAKWRAFLFSLGLRKNYWIEDVVADSNGFLDQNYFTQFAASGDTNTREEGREE